MFQQKKHLYFILFLLVFCTSCQNKQWEIAQFSTSKIAIDSTTEAGANQDYVAFLQVFKEQLAEKMNVVIGQSTQRMSVSRPESLLSNFAADVLRTEAISRLNTHIDIGIVNVGGLRTYILQGDITIGNIYEVMPFENELVILWLKGDKLGELFESIASVGGEGVSGIRMGIENGKAVNPTINGKALDLEKTYIIATSDFLAEGNDKLTQLAEYEKMEITGIKIRDIYIEYIENEAAKGNKINSQLDGRIYEIK